MNILNEAASPTSEQDLVSWKKLSFDAVTAIAGSLPSLQRIRTAAFCYGKSHLHETGLAVAAACSPAELAEAFGRNARIVEAQAREARTSRQPRTDRRRPQLTLARTVI
jgi:hypothetical protein